MIERKSPAVQTRGETEREAPPDCITDESPPTSAPFDGVIRCGRDVDALALHFPAQYDRLLRGYFRLLGDRRAWWQTDNDDERWKACVQAATRAIAERSRIETSALARYLRDGDCSGARKAVLELARGMYAGKAAA